MAASLRLSLQEREALDRERKRLGLPSLAELVRLAVLRQSIETTKKLRF